MGIAKRLNAKRFSRNCVSSKVETYYEQELLRDAIENPAAKLTLKFGPHRDKELSFAPSEYCRWLLEYSDCISPLGCEIIRDYMEAA